MEWPSPRVDGVALTLVGSGFGCLALPESITMHPVGLAVACWIAAALVIVCGFPAVQRQLHVAWGDASAGYGRATVSHPYVTSLAVALAMIVGVVFLGGVVWVLLPQKDSSSVVGTTQVPSAGQVSERIARLESPGITEDQRQKMREVLRQVPAGVTYRLMLSFPQECRKCFEYETGLLSAWDGISGWTVQEHPNVHINPQFSGVWIDTSMKECPPEEVRLIDRALRAADIKPTLDPAGGDSMGFPPGFCMMLVGNKK